MHLRAAAERQNHTSHIAFREPGGVGNHELRPHLRIVRSDANQITVALPGILVARNEAAFLQAMRVASEVRVELAVAEIETPVTVGDAAANVARALRIEGL